MRLSHPRKTHTRPSKIADIRRKVFGELTALKHAGRSKRRLVQWLCECSCGERIVVEGDRLRSGQKKCCGRNGHYLKLKCRPKWRSAFLAEYRAWASIKDRCYNKYSTRWKNYGKLKIILHAPWLNSFELFLTQVGQRPSKKHVLRRIDTSGHYEPGNVEWRIEKAQQNFSTPAA